MNEPMKINIETFWSLIDQAKEHSDQGSRGASQWLKERLMDLGEDQAVAFNNISDLYQYQADQFGLWTAATVIDENCSSTRGFKDFRLWLVSQGREVYMAALKDPDSLADAPDYQSEQCNPLAKMGSIAYKELTGEDIRYFYDNYEYEELGREVQRSIVYGEGIGYPYEWPDVPHYLPQLYNKFLTGEHRGGCDYDALRVNTWNRDNIIVSVARSVVQKNKKVKNRDAR